MSELQIIVFSLFLTLLVLFAGFFSCAETALMAVNRYRLRHQARLRKRHALRILRLLKRPDRLLAVILIGNTFTNILASSLATMLALHFWGERGALAAAICLTFIILIFAEIAPKTLAAIYPERVARWVVIPVNIFLKILYPIVWLANAITNSLLRLLHVRAHEATTIEPLSREELRSLVHDANHKLSRQYQDMLLSILDLNKLTVDDVMVPRHEIVGINIESSWEAIVAQLANLQQDWLPVFREEINQIIGVVYTKQLFSLLHNQAANKESLQQLIESPYFVPKGTTLHVQLNQFQQVSSNIAFVVDEYGDVQGLLTLYDILEEIVGDFTNATSGKKRIMLQTDDSYLVEGSVTVREFNRVSHFELPLRGPRTINGLIVEYLESLPYAGTGIMIGEYPIEILEVQRNRVKKARIYPPLSKIKNNS